MQTRTTFHRALNATPAWLFVPLVVVLVVALSQAVRYASNTAHAKANRCLAKAAEAGYPTTIEQVVAAYKPTAPEEDGAPLVLRASMLSDVNIHVQGMDRLIHSDRPAMPLPSSMLAQLEAIVKRHDTSLKLLHEAADRSTFRYPIDLGQGMRARRPHAGHVFTGVDLLVAQAALAAERGDAKQVFASLRAAITIASSLDDEPATVGILDTTRLRHQIIIDLPWIISRVQLGRDESEKLASLLIDHWPKQMLIDSLATMRVFELQDYMHLSNDVPLEDVPGSMLLEMVRQYESVLTMVRIAPMATWADYHPACLASHQANAFIRGMMYVRAAATALCIEASGHLPGSMEAIAKAYPQWDFTDPNTGALPTLHVTSDHYTLQYKDRSRPFTFRVYVENAREGLLPQLVHHTDGD